MTCTIQIKSPKEVLTGQKSQKVGERERQRERETETERQKNRKTETDRQRDERGRER